MQKQANRIEIVSWERITAELIKILETPKPSLGLIIMQQTGLMKYVFPEIDIMYGMEQPKEWHHKDIFYHTMQVKTIFGNKLLILVGKDYEYRKWLRNFFKKHKLYIIKIPDQGDDEFKNNLAIPIDIQQIHPVWEKNWDCEGCRHDMIEENF